MAGSGAGGHHISGATTGSIVGHVRAVAGDDGVGQLLRLAGEHRSADELADPSTWSTYPQAVALFEAAAAVTKDRHVGRRVGESLLRQYAGTEVASLLRSLGSPGAVLRHVAEAGAKYSTVTRMEAIEVTDGEALVEARTTPPIVRSAVFCDYTIGVLSQAAPLFGFDEAEVEESECQTRGDERCLYLVRWIADATGEDCSRRQVEHLQQQLALLVSRVEHLQATATMLVSASSVDDVLHEVMERAGVAVRAPRFMLAVRVGDADGMRILHRGFASDEAACELSRELIDPSTVHDGSRLVVPVATARRRFGVLAAIYPDGFRFFSQERDLLAAYANHAAAALESAEALQDARRQSTTARSLVRLAQAVAHVSDSASLAEALVHAGRLVAEADVASVLLWDESDGGLRLMATEKLCETSAMLLDGLLIRPSDTPALQSMLVTPAPLIFDTGTDDPFLRNLLLVAQVEQAAVVPLVARGELLGIVAVGFTVARAVTDDLIERLGGIADCASPAAENVRLLEGMRHHATHDALTGLVNSRGLGDRARPLFEGSRPERAPIGVLFVDLDRFKPINDTYGHDAGDQVLRDVARRIRAATRTSDVVARIGGDEFVVLLPHVADASEAAAVSDRVARAIEGPYTVGAATVRLAASVGLAVIDEPDQAAFVEVLRIADAAMYERKLQRRLADSISSR